jgi:CBS domain-containing protein
MNAADLMTRKLYTVPPGTGLLPAIRLMLQNRFSGLPVTDEQGRILGMVTEGDLLRRSELGTERNRPGWLQFLRGPGRQADDYTRENARKVDEIMTSNLVCAEESTPAEKLVELMESNHVKRIPIVRDGVLVGIVSRSDLLRHLAACLEKEVEGPTDDATIRATLEETLHKLHWVPLAGLKATVADGTVELEGVLDDDRQRWALVVAAENVPGVKGVVDKLVVVEPETGMIIPTP